MEIDVQVQKLSVVNPPWMAGLGLAPLLWVLQDVYRLSSTVQQGTPLWGFNGIQKSSQFNLQLLNCVLHILLHCIQAAVKTCVLLTCTWTHRSRPQVRCRYCRSVANQEEEESNRGGEGMDHGEEGNLWSSWWQRVSKRVCERRESPQKSSNPEPDWKPKDFFFSTTLPLSLVALRPLSCSLIFPSLTWLRPVS